MAMPGAWEGFDSVLEGALKAVDDLVSQGTCRLFNDNLSFFKEVIRVISKRQVAVIILKELKVFWREGEEGGGFIGRFVGGGWFFRALEREGEEGFLIQGVVLVHRRWLSTQ